MRYYRYCRLHPILRDLDELLLPGPRRSAVWTWKMDYISDAFDIRILTQAISMKRMHARHIDRRILPIRICQNFLMADGTNTVRVHLATPSPERL